MAEGRTKRTHLKAADRRALCRAAAFTVLRRGDVDLEGLGLRHVAQELDVSLSTVTYAYPNIEALLTDMVRESVEGLWPSVIAGISNRGLRAELREVAKVYYLATMHDPAREALLRYEIRETVARSTYVRGRLLPSTADEQVASGVVRAIRVRANEHYRIPDIVLAVLLQSMTDGLLLHWISEKNDARWWGSMMATIDAAVLLADPRPVVSSTLCRRPMTTSTSPHLATVARSPAHSLVEGHRPGRGSAWALHCVGLGQLSPLGEHEEHDVAV